jgi:hypothetical protein
VEEASSHPIERPFDEAKLKRVPPLLKTAKGTSVTIPDNPDDKAEVSVSAEKLQKLAIVPPVAPDATDGTTHSEIQWLLLKLGGDIGLDVWVAKNDKTKTYKGQPFSTINRLIDTLPLQFDEATTRTIQLIDVHSKSKAQRQSFRACSVCQI